MPRGKKKTIHTIKLDGNELLDAIEKSNESTISITGAEIKDDLCNYSYEIVSGKHTGFTHNVKGTGLIDDDMRTAFSKLNVHLAVIDDVYKHSDIQIGDIDRMHTDDLALLFNVTGFKIKGGEENASITLLGTKYLSAGARMKLESPKIPIDNLSSYQWYNELKTAADKCREEVEAYHNGKYTPVQVEEEEPDARQLTIGSEEARADQQEEEFENAKV
ncbi:MAG: hypothetical protein ACJ749_11100 [Flavisolibacter sp.]|jgi:hypothetical protein